MTQLSSSTKFTYEDYLLFPEDGKRHELIDGEHFVTPAPMTKHQRISGNLFLSLGTYIQKRTCGQLFTAPTDVVLSNLDVVQPDLVFLSAARASFVTEKNTSKVPRIWSLKFFLSLRARLMKSSNASSMSGIKSQNIGSLIRSSRR